MLKVTRTAYFIGVWQVCQFEEWNLHRLSRLGWYYYQQSSTQPVGLLFQSLSKAAQESQTLSCSFHSLP